MKTYNLPDEFQLHPEVIHFLARPKLLFINGEWQEPAAGGRFTTYDPSSGAAIVNVAEAGAADIDRAVAAARQAFESGPWSRMAPAARERLILRLADLIELHGEELAQLDTLDNGGPIAGTRANIPYACSLLRYPASWAAKLEGKTITPSLTGNTAAQLTYTLREPVGVVAQIIPWNAPLPLTTLKLGGPLAAGCTVVLKPAEQTPLSALRVAELIQEAGFPPGVINIVTGFGDPAGAALAAHPDVDKVTFTGSAEVGRAIVRAAAGNLKRVSLELGGKSPSIIFADADIKAAIPNAAIAVFANSGQLCTAASRLFVQRKVFDEVVAGVAAYSKELPVGPGFAAGSVLGPIISGRQMERVLGYIEAGRKDGGQLVCGGSRLYDKGYFVEPTVFTEVQPQWSVMREEIFGPVVCAIPFDDEEEVIAAANATSTGLAGGVWTNNLGTAHRVAARLRTGMVFVNGYHAYDPAVPFGGYKQSGWDREGGREGVEMFTEVKAVTIALPSADAASNSASNNA